MNLEKLINHGKVIDYWKTFWSSWKHIYNFIELLDISPVFVAKGKKKRLIKGLHFFLYVLLLYGGKLSLYGLVVYHISCFVEKRATLVKVNRRNYGKGNQFSPNWNFWWYELFKKLITKHTKQANRPTKISSISCIKDVSTVYKDRR